MAATGERHYCTLQFQDEAIFWKKIPPEMFHVKSLVTYLRNQARAKFLVANKGYNAIEVLKLLNGSVMFLIKKKKENKKGTPI